MRKIDTRKILLLPLAFTFAALAAALAFAGCGAGSSESKMTSYSGTETKADTALLFSVPQDQLAHVQVVAVEKQNSPVSSASPAMSPTTLSKPLLSSAPSADPSTKSSSLPVKPSTPASRSSLLTARTIPPRAPPTSKLAMPIRSPKKFTIAPRIFTLTAPSPRPIYSKPNPHARSPKPICNPAKMPCAPSASTIPKPS